MEEEIILGGKKVKCQWRVEIRSRRLRLAIHPEGFLSVVLPGRASQEKAKEFIQEKSAWILAKLSYFERHRPAEKVADNYNDFLRRKRLAYQLVTDSLAKINTIYNFKYKKVSIRNQKSRWGSCTSGGDLSFNYRLSYVPLHLVDYVVAHELCHLQELNHSQAFWRLVARAVPDYRQARRELKKEALRFW